MTSQEPQVHVCGGLSAHSCADCTAELQTSTSQDSIHINTTLIEPFEGHIGSQYQFIGEMCTTGERAVLKALVVRCMDGVNLKMYERAEKAFKDAHMPSDQVESRGIKEQRL